MEPKNTKCESEFKVAPELLSDLVTIKHTNIQTSKSTWKKSIILECPVKNIMIRGCPLVFVLVRTKLV